MEEEEVEEERWFLVEDEEEFEADGTEGGESRRSTSIPPFSDGEASRLWIEGVAARGPFVAC